jgi:hypothetical protein
MLYTICTLNVPNPLNPFVGSRLVVIYIKLWLKKSCWPCMHIPTCTWDGKKIATKKSFVIHYHTCYTSPFFWLSNKKWLKGFTSNIYLKYGSCPSYWKFCVIKRTIRRIGTMIMTWASQLITLWTKLKRV